LGNQGTTGTATQGIQGILGSQGTTGTATQGIQGILGNQGTTGTATQGITGTQGVQGRQGITGANTGGVISGVFASAVFNPGDGVTYFGGARAALSTTSANGVSRLYIPYASTLTSSYIFVANDGTLGSAETSTIAIIKNGATGSPTTVSSALRTDSSAAVYSNTGLSISLAAGDYIEWRWIAPTYATNPTNVRIWCIAHLTV
jgi:hypothetical protein